MVDVADVIRHNREKLKLLAYFLIMVVVTQPLAVTLGQAWQRANLPKNVILALKPLLSITLAQFATAMFGVFLGFVVLLVSDPKKRWQGILLSVGLLVSLIGLQSIGLFLPNIDFVANGPWLLAGGIVGLVAGGGRRLARFQTSEPLEFRRAATGIFYVLSLIIVVALVEYHVDYPQLIRPLQDSVQVQTQSLQGFSLTLDQTGLFRNLVLASVFVVTLQKFMQYDAEQGFFVLGPPGSGKSLFLIGAYREALEQEAGRDATTPMNPSGDLMEMVQQLDMDTSDWIVEATGAGQVKTLSFRYVHGKIFPKNIQVTSLDYAGEYLDRLPDALTGLIENEEDQTLLSLAENVSAADTLIFLVDVERFDNNEPLDIAPYVSILQATDDKNVMLVATKADILADQFKDERGLEAHRYFEEFTEYVNDTLGTNEQVRTLIQQTSGSEIHPVYYQTKEAEFGDGRVPMRDERGQVITVGFESLLERLGR